MDGKPTPEKLETLALVEAEKPHGSWVKHLRPLLYSEEDPFVLSKLLKVVGKHNGPGVLSILEPFLNHEDERIISNCLEALGFAGGPQDLERVAAFLDHSEARIKSTAVSCLWNFNPQAGFAVIKKMAGSSKVWERDAAKFALKNCPLEEAKDLLAVLEQSIPKVKAAPELSASETPPPEWIKKSGLFGKIITFPVEVGMDRPLPLWLFVLFVAGCLIFFFYIALPFVDWLMPPPAP